MNNDILLDLKKISGLIPEHTPNFSYAVTRLNEIKSIATEAIKKWEALASYKGGEDEQMPVLNPDKKLIPYVPMSILNEEWAQKNHGQSLARLKERQGLSLSEIVAITEKRKWHEIGQLQCLSIIATKLLAQSVPYKEEVDKEKCTKDPNTCKASFCGWPHNCEDAFCESKEEAGEEGEQQKTKQEIMKQVNPKASQGKPWTSEMIKEAMELYKFGSKDEDEDEDKPEKDW